MVNSRLKGASFEREISKLLFENLGMEFKRDLDQYRAADHGDLICEDPDFPFIIECKRRVGGSYSRAWMEQAEKAANRVGKHPCVIYRFNHQPSIAVIKMLSFAKAVGGSWVESEEVVSMTVDAFCSIARELMAYEILKEDDATPCEYCDGTGVYEKIFYMDFGRGKEPCGEEITCPYCEGSGEQ